MKKIGFAGYYIGSTEGNTQIYVLGGFLVGLFWPLVMIKMMVSK